MGGGLSRVDGRQKKPANPGEDSRATYSGFGGNRRVRTGSSYEPEQRREASLVILRPRQIEKVPHPVGIGGQWPSESATVTGVALSTPIGASVSRLLKRVKRASFRPEAPAIAETPPGCW